MNDAFCKIPVGEYVNTRRCFITGEHCSKQTDIYKARKKLSEKENTEINAFVIMNFSNMSDVAYEQRLKPFIEGLTKYFYFTDDMKNIACVADPDSLPSKIVNDQKKRQVEKINVVRADSNFVSNFVICNRVCQQMQVADLIVVDVSVRNANVFYELGMAIAMGKLILPVCFSDSYFHIDSEIEKLKLEIPGPKHHIARYTWRRHLFEYYGIRCKKINENDDTEYLQVNKNGQWEPGLSNLEGNSKGEGKRNGADPLVAQYFEFPYVENQIGEKIYERLSKSYNAADRTENTLLLYTLERFLNQDQVGQCIVNYYNYITYQMKKLQCFCGDRVGTLAQTNYIPEHDKDDVQKIPRQLPYNVSEIIHLGVNQATYTTYQDTIKPLDFLNLSGVEDELKEEGTQSYEQRLRFLKEYTGNRSMLMYPGNPVYVERMTERVQTDLLNNEGLEKYFCLYHIMLHNLRYVREIVVDISSSSLEALFWLGMAHGADVYAITVQRQETDQEREQTTGTAERKERSIFDVAGLWCAQFRTDDTQGFYQQLQSVNQSIEQHSKLLRPNIRQHEVNMLDQLRALPWERSKKKKAAAIMEEIDSESESALESYYRTRLWQAMLKGNHVQVYVHEKDEKIRENEYSSPVARDLESRANISRWDFDAVAAFSRYLARRTPVGEYEVIAHRENDVGLPNRMYNVINLGANSAPFPGTENRVGLSQFIASKSSDLDIKVRRFLRHKEACNLCSTCGGDGYAYYRGFVARKNDKIINGWFTQLAHERCKTNMNLSQSLKDNLKLYDLRTGLNIENGNITLPPECDVAGKDHHLQLGQLLLWREDDNGGRQFYISLEGVSGPATKALSSLLISDPLKDGMFDKEFGQWKGQYRLSELQAEIRKQFINKFAHTVGDDPNIKPVADATKLYLTTVLYRYFLPFLTRENERRIINGAEYFLRSLRLSDGLTKDEQIALGIQNRKPKDDESIMTVINILKRLISSFQGVDALYQVKVIVKNKEDVDSRSIISIEPMRSSGKPDENHDDWLQCLYM